MTESRSYCKLVFKKEEVKEGNNEISRKKRKEGELKTVKGSKKGHPVQAETGTKWTTLGTLV